MWELLEVCFTHTEDFSLVFIQSIRVFLGFLPYKLGNGLHGEPQKENSKQCDRFGVRVRCVMKWHSLYQSVSHSVTAVVPECWLPLRPGPSPHSPASASGKLSFSGPPVFSVPFRSFTSFYLNFTSCPFSVYYFLKLLPRLSGKGGRREAC